MMNFLCIHYFREYEPKENGAIYNTIAAAFDNIPNANNFDDEGADNIESMTAEPAPQTEENSPSPVSNTAVKISLKCSDYNGGYGSSFDYNGQTVKKTNNNWNSNNS